MNDKLEIWDEFRWEEFLKEQDKKIDRYMELFYRHRGDYYHDEMIARDMDWNWLSEHEQLLLHDDDIEENEGWKIQAGVEENDAPFVHNEAYDFLIKAITFVDQLPENKRNDSAVVDFLSNAMIASAKVTSGSDMGDDIDEIGGNIAYCKRGLLAANHSLEALREMKEKGIVRGDPYFFLTQDLVETRNRIALHILDLREKFISGI
jgi:hypothetical protein